MTPLDYKWVKSLSQASVRRREGCFVAEGHHLAGEALVWGRVRLLAVEEGREAACAAELEAANARGIPVYTVPAFRMQNLLPTKSPQGIFCVAEYRCAIFSPEHVPQRGLLCALERVQDPGNVGTILRTADALGLEGVLCSDDSADITNDKTLRASMGALYRVPVWRTDNLPWALKTLHEKGWETLCGHLKGESIFEAPHAGDRQVLVIGNEGAGVSDACAWACARLVRLPMPGGAESLNAAVASGVLLYELSRAMGRI